MALIYLAQYISIMIHTITLFHLVLAIWSIVSVHAGNNNKAGSAAIPRSKVKKGGALGRVFGHGIMQKMFREMKISFCSELEALTLQVCRYHTHTIFLTIAFNILGSHSINNRYLVLYHLYGFLLSAHATELQLNQHGLPG